jgi:hypothetical protein
MQAIANAPITLSLALPTAANKKEANVGMKRTTIVKESFNNIFIIISY